MSESNPFEAWLQTDDGAKAKKLLDRVEHHDTAETDLNKLSPQTAVRLALIDAFYGGAMHGIRTRSRA